MVVFGAGCSAPGAQATLRPTKRRPVRVEGVVRPVELTVGYRLDSGGRDQARLGGSRSGSWRWCGRRSWSGRASPYAVVASVWAERMFGTLSDARFAVLVPPRHGIDACGFCPIYDDVPQPVVDAGRRAVDPPPIGSGRRERCKRVSDRDIGAELEPERIARISVTWTRIRFTSWEAKSGFTFRFCSFTMTKPMPGRSILVFGAWQVDRVAR